MFLFGKKHWGKGYASEAMAAFLPWCFRRYDLDRIDADHFADNPASGRVLEKLGFIKIGASSAESLARVEPGAVVLYRLSHTDMKDALS